VTPFNAHAAKSVNDFATYGSPTKGFVEQVYCLYPYADSQGQTTILLQNAAADRGVSMSFALEQLPYVTLWKNTNAKEEGYVTGLEPGTGFPYTRRLERQAGRVPKLKPGETRSFTIDFAIHSGADAVRLAGIEIRNIQKNRSTQIDTEPAKAE
jgi:galactose mutarotase-like enzyme